MISINQDDAIYGLIERIILLPKDEIARLIDFVSDLEVENSKKVRACSDPNSIMNTRPFHFDRPPFKRDELYE